MSAYRCRGCGQLNSIVAVSLVPWIMAVYPSDQDSSEFEQDPHNDQVFWEVAIDMGFGCRYPECPYTEDNQPVVEGDGIPTIRSYPGFARHPLEIADLVD